MHDPLTVAFDIPNPFARRYSWGNKFSNRPSLVTVWHKDPEADGSDDSCGFSYARVTSRDREWAQKHAQDCWESFFGTQYQSINIQLAGSIEVIAEGWRCARACVTGKWAVRLKPWELCEVIGLASSPGDNLRSLAREATLSEEGFARLILCLVRIFRTEVRHWWQRPRWHIHHWRIQVHPWQRLRRRFWERCDMCRKRFRGGSAIGNWDGTRKWCSSCDSGLAKPAPTKEASNG